MAILVLVWLAAACQSEVPAEDCAVAGDEDENGRADCDDPACTADPSCQPRCGDGQVEAGEGCDDGNASNTDECTSACAPAVCGDGFVRAGVEACDDGNRIDGDGCDSDCTLTECGNGIVTVGEQCDDGNKDDSDGCTSKCKLAVCGDGIVRAGVEECDAGNADAPGCDDNCTSSVLAYIKASNTGAGDQLGYSVALSADGSTLAVGAPLEDSAATGIGATQADDAAPDAGAVYVFTRSGTVWSQQAYIKASNTGFGDQFGSSVALSADGSTLAVGAPSEASAATGIGGIQSDNSAPDAGAVYVFTRSGTAWSQQAYVKASNTGAFDAFGGSVALSADGSTLAVGASQEDSAAIGVGGEQNDEDAPDAGAVYVFARGATTWSQQAYVKASNTGAFDAFGGSIALSADGATLAVGAAFESSAATGLGGDQTDDSALFAGAAYLFARSGTAWRHEAYVKASNTGEFDCFGYRVALSADGATLAVSAPFEDSAATGIGGNQADDSAQDAGAVYVFERSVAGTFQRAYVKASNTGADDAFGVSLALSADGMALAVGAAFEDSAALGIGRDRADNAAQDAGAVYVLTRSGTAWSQPAYVKASNTDAGDSFGHGLALSSDGSILAAGAIGEDSIGGSQTDNAAPGAGAVYVYH